MSKRRDLLKWTGAGIVAGTTGLFGNAAATSGQTRSSEQFREEMAEAKRIEHEEGLAAKKRFLRNEGYRFTINTHTADVNLGGSADDVGQSPPGLEPQKIDNPDDGGIEFRFSGYHDYYSDEYCVDLDVYYNFSARADYTGSVMGISSGETPDDGAGIFYKPEEDYWHLANGNKSEDVVSIMYADYDSGATTLTNGKVGFRYNDREAYEDWRDDQNWGTSETKEGRKVAGYCMVYLTPHGDHDEDDRVVYAAYTHAYDTINIDPSLSLSYPPTATITAGFGTSVDQTKINTNEDGDWLRIYQSDM